MSRGWSHPTLFAPGYRIRGTRRNSSVADGDFFGTPMFFWITSWPSCSADHGCFRMWYRRLDLPLTLFWLVQLMANYGLWIRKAEPQDGLCRKVWLSSFSLLLADNEVKTLQIRSSVHQPLSSRDLRFFLIHRMAHFIRSRKEFWRGFHSISLL